MQSEKFNCSTMTVKLRISAAKLLTLIPKENAQIFYILIIGDVRPYYIGPIYRPIYGTYGVVITVGLSLR